MTNAWILPTTVSSTTPLVSNGSVEPVDEDLYFDSSPIIAYRAWILRNNQRRNVRLTSTTQTFIPWLPLKIQRARCLQQLKRNTVRVKQGGQIFAFDYGDDGYTHGAPKSGCTCGLHAVKTFDAAKSWGATWSQKQQIIGKVVLWGTVLEYEDGYRAEYAYPYEFFIRTDNFPSRDSMFDKDELLNLLKQYKVDLTYVDTY